MKEVKFTLKAAVTGVSPVKTEMEFNVFITVNSA